MSCIVRIEALLALGALFEAAIPEVAGAVCVGTPAPNHYEHLPNISIEPSRWAWNPEQAEESAILPGNRVVWSVGEHTCAAVISVMAATGQQRAALEAKVLDVFLSQVNPAGFHTWAGIIVLPVTACPSLGQWTACFELESDEWIDTMMLDRRYESRIVMNAIIPALVLERPVYTIAELQLGIQATTQPLQPVPSGVELFTINADGTITSA